MPVRSAPVPRLTRSPPCLLRCSACCATTALTTSPQPYVTSPGPLVLRSVFSTCILHNEKTLLARARMRGSRSGACPGRPLHDSLVRRLDSSSVATSQASQIPSRVPGPSLPGYGGARAYGQAAAQPAWPAWHASPTGRHVVVGACLPLPALSR